MGSRLAISCHIVCRMWFLYTPTNNSARTLDTCPRSESTENKAYGDASYHRHARILVHAEDTTHTRWRTRGLRAICRAREGAGVGRHREKAVVGLLDMQREKAARGQLAPARRAHIDVCRGVVLLVGCAQETPSDARAQGPLATPRSAHHSPASECSTVLQPPTPHSNGMAALSSALWSTSARSATDAFLTQSSRAMFPAQPAMPHGGTGTGR